MRPEIFKVWQQVPLKQWWCLWLTKFDTENSLQTICIYKQQIIQPEVRLLTFWGFVFKLHHFNSLEVICRVLCAPVLPDSDCRLYHGHCHMPFMCTQYLAHSFVAYFLMVLYFRCWTWWRWWL